MKVFGKCLVSKQSVFFILLIFCFLLLKLFNLAPRISDENFYFYTANLLAKGILPYRDFFFQHYPLQILMYSVIIRLFGFNLVIIKLFYQLFNVGTAVILFKMFVGNKKKEFGLTSAVLFLSSFVLLAASDYALGVHEATFLFVLSWKLLLDKRPKTAGLILFLGLTMRIYVLPAALGLMVFEVFNRRWRSVVNYITYSVGPFLLLTGILYLIFGEQFLTPVWRYHFLKPTMNVNQRVFSDFTKNDSIMMLFALSGAFLLFKEVREYFNKGTYLKHSGEDHIKVGLSAFFSLVFQYLFLYNLSNVFQMYFVSLEPFFAVLASIALIKYSPERSRRSVILLMLALSLMNGFLYQKNVAKPHVLGEIDKIISDIKDNSDKNDTIYGSYVDAPLFALLANRSITDNQVDTNSMRNLTGLLTSEQGTRLATKSAFFIQDAIIDEKSGKILMVQPSYVDWDILNDNCDKFKIYNVEEDFTFNAIVVWKCLNNDNSIE